MQLGMVGLGRMGAAMVRRLMTDGHDCVVYDLDTSRVADLESRGATGARSFDALVAQLTPPRAVWVMVPAGAPTEMAVSELATRLDGGDVVIDGGNSYYRDAIRRSTELAARRVDHVDVGTSGGVWGEERGYCLMVGGDPDTVSRLDPIFRTLAPGPDTVPATPGRRDDASTASRGYLHCGPVGAGHFVKMIHNGIEYGVMQAYAEGFELLRGAGAEDLPDEVRYDLDLGEIAEVWRRGSVIGSWLLDLTAGALARDPTLSAYEGVVQDSGEGRWTVQTAVERATPAHVLSAALFARFRSRRDHTFADKTLSAMRHAFGGHLEPPSGE